MIPPFERNGNLPPGVHGATWQEFVQRFGWNSHRRRLLAGMRRALDSLGAAGCKLVYMAGSFVTMKPRPSDFDGCWAPAGVDWSRLDPALRTFDRRRATQKAWCGGELFPADFPADVSMQTYFDFLQKDKDNNPKGMVAIDPGTS